MDETLKNLQKQIGHCENIISEQLANYKLQKEIISKYELDNIKLQEIAKKSLNVINIMLKTFDLINTNVDLQILEINNEVRSDIIKIDPLKSIKKDVCSYLNKTSEQIINEEPQNFISTNQELLDRKSSLSNLAIKSNNNKKLEYYYQKKRSAMNMIRDSLLKKNEIAKIEPLKYNVTKIRDSIEPILISKHTDRSMIHNKKSGYTWLFSLDFIKGTKITHQIIKKHLNKSDSFNAQDLNLYCRTTYKTKDKKLNYLFCCHKNIDKKCQVKVKAVIQSDKSVDIYRNNKEHNH